MPHKEQLDYSGRFGLEKNDERHKKIAFTHTIIVKAILFEHFLCEGTGQDNEDTTLSKKAPVFYYHVKEKMDFICGTSRDML